MRSVLYILLLAICLIACECSGTANSSQSEEKGPNGETGDTLTATSNTEVQVNSQVEPQADGEKTQPQLVEAAPVKPKPVVVVKDVLEVKDATANKEGEQQEDEEEEEEHTEEDDSNKPPKEDKAPSAPPAKQSTSPHDPQPAQPSAGPQQQQQQIQQQQQHAARQGSTPTKGVTGETLQTGHAAPQARTPEDLSQTARVLTPANIPAGGARQEQPNAPEEVPAQQSPSPSQSTKASKKQTQEKPPTTKPTTDNQTAKDTSPLVTAAARADKDQVSSAKPAPSTTLHTNTTATHTDTDSTTTGDKQTASTQTSVPSTAESAKVESPVPTTHLPKLSKAIQSLDNKDISITISSLFALPALIILFVVSAAPES